MFRLICFLLVCVSMSSQQNISDTENTTVSTVTASPSTSTTSSPTTTTTTTISSTPQAGSTVGVSPTCNESYVDSCVATFSSYYVRVNMTTNTKTIKQDLLNSPFVCGNFSSSCASSVAVNNSYCGATTQSDNKTYGLLCTDKGLKVYSFSSASCDAAKAMNYTMSVLCRAENNTLNCTTTDWNGLVYETSSKSLLIGPMMSGCTTKKPATTQIPLLPNPVGPAAITAIVVLVCLFITAILAGMFFWPKCHIADPAARAIKKVTRPAAASAAAAANSSSAAGRAPASAAGQEPSRVAYNSRSDTATVKIPPTYGPSAA